MRSYNNEAFDIIILAGQSNAYGYGIGEAEYEYIPTDKVLYLDDRSNPHFVEDENGHNEFFIDYPSEPYIFVADEPCDGDGNKIGKLALAFAREYIDRGLLEEGKRLLIVNAAVGGSAFLWGQWGIGNILYTRLCDMLESVLYNNKNNRLVAFLWHQGETDASEHRDWDAEKKYTVHKSFLSSMLRDFYGKYSPCALPFIAGGFCDQWYLPLKEYCDPILRAIRETALELGGAFVETTGLKSNDQTVGNGDPIHFSRQSARILGGRYFEKYLEIKANKKGTDIRKATNDDLPYLMPIFDEARGTIAALGIDQWQSGYPSQDVIANDIALSRSYLVECDGIVASFAVIDDGEPTYDKIYSGEWKSGNENDSYIALHRVAVSVAKRGTGISGAIIDFATWLARSAGRSSLRIDTHRGNVVMRRMLEKHGFVYCGIIYLANGDERVAYEKLI